mmetsp:Transcript_15947/g.23773  ORF Transcript_15947/g.23773 Transcript_15947/m.23773 type:complete len:245 (-) Transcript_15947:425-1159(-)
MFLLSSYLEVCRHILERQLFTILVFSNDIKLRYLGVEFNKHHLQLFSRNNFLLNQSPCEVIKKRTVVRNDLLCLHIRVIDKTLNLCIGFSHNLRSPSGSLLSHVTSHERPSLLRGRESNTSDLITHSPLLNHALGNVCHLLEIVGSSSGGEVLSENNLLSKTSSKSNSELRLKVLSGVKSSLETALLRGEEGKSSSSIGSGDDGNLLYLIVIGDESSNDSMSSLMISNKLILFSRKSRGTSLLL